MKILITGGAGFIGSHSVEAALAAGHSVRVFDNLSTGKRENLPLDLPGVELVVGNVLGAGQVRAAVMGVDAVLHLAAQVSVPESMEAPDETLAINTMGTANVLDACRRAGVRRFVLASTSSVYGDLPGRQDEHTAVAPISPYGASKLMAEQWAQVYTAAYGLETVILRYFNVYGPRQPADSPYSGVLALWSANARNGAPCTVFGDGEQTRDFVSVRDVAAANLLALTGKIQAGAVYPVATGLAVSLNQILVTLDALRGQPVAREYAAARDGDIVHSVGDSTRLQAVGWWPQVTLMAGIAEMLGEPLVLGGE